MERGSSALVVSVTVLTLVAGQIMHLNENAYQKNHREPEFLGPLENITVAQGRSALFTCSVNNLGDYKVAWIKSDTKLILAIHTQMVVLNNHLSVTHNGHNTWKLYIHNVKPKDSGTYMCQINTDPMKSVVGFLTVVVPPDIVDDAEGGGSSVKEGGDLNLSCKATGVPTPQISWRRDGGKQIMIRSHSGKVEQVKDIVNGSVLKLTSMLRVDMGGYLCIASNGVPPTVSKRYKIDVLFPPLVKTHMRVVNALNEADVTLQCFVEAYPRALNHWRSSTGLKLLSNNKYTVNEVNLNDYTVQLNLTIRYLRKEDFGDYTCSAVNAYGSDDSQMRLQEKYVPPKPTTTTIPITRKTTTTPKTTTARVTTPYPLRTRKQYSTKHVIHPTPYLIPNEISVVNKNMEKQRKIEILKQNVITSKSVNISHPLSHMELVICIFNMLFLIN